MADTAPTGDRASPAGARGGGQDCGHAEASLPRFLLRGPTGSTYLQGTGVSLRVDKK